MQLVLLVEDDDERAAKIEQCVPHQVRWVRARSAGAAIGILRRDKFTGILLDFDLYRSAHASRPSMLSRARYTSPIPPTPSSATISYGPSFAPEVRGTVRGIIASNSRALQRSYHRVRVKLPEGSV